MDSIPLLLCKFESLVITTRHLFALCPEVRCRSHIPSDGSCLLTRNILVHPSHPGVHLVTEKVLPQVMDMLGPSSYLLSFSKPWSHELCHETYAFILCFDEANVVIATVFDTLCYPSDSIFDAARNVPVRLVRTHRHEHVRKVLYSYA